MSLLKKIRKFFHSENKEDNTLITIVNSENNRKALIREWWVYGNTDFYCGYANGYVAIPPSHPLYGKDYEFVNQIKGFDIQGGVTYSAMASEINNRKDYKNFEVKGNRQLPDNWWVFGFDTFHPYFESNEYTQLHREEQIRLFYCELANLRKQLEEYWIKKPVVEVIF